MTTEYPLARQADPYLVVDLSTRVVELKASGRRLRSFEIADEELTAEVGEDEPTWSLIQKKPLQKTERTRIKPGAGEQGVVAVASQEPWGPHRMPMDYDLICSDAKVLEVRALPAVQPGSGMVRSIKTVYRRMADRIRHWSLSGQDDGHVVQVWLSEEDSQLLFWSLPKQLKIVIRGKLTSLPVMGTAGTANKSPPR
jgi:hypothetical protein